MNKGHEEVFGHLDRGGPSRHGKDLARENRIQHLGF